jgi:2-polyprenyl-3-methyl-5-hydroxy-6-metoxy-1,4-benzoquinol methylase
MDDPALDPARHAGALQGLEQINRVSRTVAAVATPLRALALELERPVRVLDVATGAGDLPIGLWELSQKEGIPLDVTGCDRSSFAMSFARKRAQAKRAAVDFFSLDLLEADLPSDFDAITCCLFLHHLSDADGAAVLRRAAAAARHLVVANDLIRSSFGLGLAWLGSRLLAKSEIVHIDGPRSVRAAYTRSEAQVLAERAGLEGATVERIWPCRFQLVWRRP